MIGDELEGMKVFRRVIRLFPCRWKRLFPREEEVRHAVGGIRRRRAPGDG